MDQEQEYNPTAEINSRLRILESKYALMRERVFVVNQNMIEEYKKLMSEIKAVDSELKEIKKDLFTIRETTANLVKEIEMLARKDQLKILEKYINFWNPLNFVTEKDVEEMIENSAKKKRKNVKKSD